MPATDPSILLQAGAPRWRDGGPLVLTFSFAADGLDAAGNGAGTWAAFTAAQRHAARQALEAWAAVSGLGFLEVPDRPGGAGIDLRFRMEALGLGVFGEASPPGDGDIALNLTLFRSDPLTPGTTRVGFPVLLHEIGHTLGLDHPDEVPGATRDLTVMANMAGVLAQPAAPRALDAAAVASLYGTPAEAAGREFAWDAAAGVVRGAGEGRVAGTDLRDALAGGGGADWLRGFAGDDTLAGGAGDDSLDGGEGFDLLASPFAFAEVRLDLPAGVLAAPDGTDRFSGIEAIQFADGRLALDEADPAAFVLRLYRVALDRLPDPTGQAHWTLALMQGADPAAIAAGFVNSHEFAERFGALDDGGFARLLAGHLGAPELALDLAEQLAGGASRAQVLAELADGWAARRATAADVAAGVWDLHETAAEVAMLYRLAFGSAPAPEEWTRLTALHAGTGEARAVAATILDDAGFGEAAAAALVPVLLTHLLGAAPEAADAAPWLDRAAGLDGAGMLLAIAETRPFGPWITVSAEGVLFA